MIRLAAVPLLAQAAIVAALWPWTVRLDPRPAIRLLAALTGASAAIVVLQIGLGLFGRLASGPLAIAVISLVALLAAGAFAARDRSAPWLPRIARPTPVGLLLGGLAFAAWIAIAGVCVLVPPWGWDTLSYHLTQVFEIARTGTLQPLAFPARWMFFPLVGELHASFWVLLSGAGPDSWRLAGLAQAPLALTAGVAARALAEAIGLRAGLAWIAPALALTPVVLIQPSSGYVDIAEAAFTLAALAFAAVAMQDTLPGSLRDASLIPATRGRRRFLALALCLLACGLALGVKIAFAVFVPALLLILMRRGAGARWREALAGWTAVKIAVLALCLCAGAGYWWARNTVETGNPLYPSQVRLGATVILPGPHTLEGKEAQEHWFVTGRSQWLRYPMYETFRGQPAWTIENGFGPLFAAGLAASLAALLLALRRRDSATARVLLGLPVSLALFHVAHLSEPRYVIAVCGLALVGLAALVESFDRGKAGRVATGVLHAAVVAACAFAAVGGVASAAPGLPTALRAWAAGEWNPQSYYPVEYAHAGEAFNWISEHSARAPDPATTVTTTNGTFLAPLYGWAGRNRVVYARVPGDLAVGARWQANDAAEWRAFLLNERVDMVVVWVPWWNEARTDPAEEWIASDPAGFETLAEFPGARIVKPVFTETERAVLAGLPPSGPRVDRLGVAANWSVEYSEGAGLQVKPGDEPGEVRLDYELRTAGNDYADARVGVDDGDWTRARALSFDVKGAGAPAWLFVHIKDHDTSKSVRYRIDLQAGDRRVTLDFSKPEAKSLLFSWARVGEVHFVIDDAREEVTARGSLLLGGFRLEPLPADSTVSSPVAGTGPGIPAKHTGTDV